MTPAQTSRLEWLKSILAIVIPIVVVMWAFLQVYAFPRSEGKVLESRQLLVLEELKDIKQEIRSVNRELSRHLEIFRRADPMYRGENP